MYSEQEKKVVVANETASIIWTEINKSNANDEDLTTKQIACVICEKYCLDENAFNEVCNDVNQTIDMLFQAALLLHCQDYITRVAEG